MADCIPAGMESFVATDDEQFNVIKKVIDLCDYYILIIGGRYGSVNQSSGISYTEMEYEYALSKEIPVLVFSIDDSIKLDVDKQETDDVLKGKLAEFKRRAMKNRLASVWKDSGDLVGKVAISIMSAKQQIDRPGWIRGGVDQKELLKEIIELKNENSNLREQVEKSQVNGLSQDEEELGFYGFQINLNYTEDVMFFTTDTIIGKKVVTTTLDDLFKFISLRLTGKHRNEDFIDAVSSFVSGYYVDKQQALILRNQYKQLGLIKCYQNPVGVEFIELTEKGIRVMNELNTLK